MNAQEFEEWQDTMGYSDAEAAQALGLSVSTVRNYRRGKRPDAADVVIPKTVELACAHLKATRLAESL